MEGLYQITGLQCFLITVALTHVTIIAVTLYLHRAMSHRAIDIHPGLAHVFRLWLWLSTGMKTKEWVAVHRKHHAEVDREADPHSPVVHGVWHVLFLGVWLYRKEAKQQETLEKFGHGCPDDWLERNVYHHWNIGVLVMLAIDLFLWGNKGVLIWAVQMLWIPLTAAGVINGIGHAFGYRNYEPMDASRNIVPWGIVIGGEELHNNHHAYPRSAKLSSRRFEFDLGYVYIKCLSYLGLAKVRYIMPQLNETRGGLKELLNARMVICREYSTQVMRQALKDSQLYQRFGSVLKTDRLKGLILRNPGLLKSEERVTLDIALSLDLQLSKVYEFKTRLYAIFYEKGKSDRMQEIRQWCQQAHASQEEVLTRFASWIEERFVVSEVS